jgi:hypothetical protein
LDKLFPWKQKKRRKKERKKEGIIIIIIIIIRLIRNGANTICPPNFV